MRLERTIEVDGQKLLIKKTVNKKGALCLEMSTMFGKEKFLIEADFEENEERDKTFYGMDELEASSVLQVLRIQHGRTNFK